MWGEWGWKGFETTLWMLVVMGVIAMPFLYQFRMETGVFRFDLYLIWILGALAWIYLEGNTVIIRSKAWLVLLPCLLYLVCVTWYWQMDDNSTSFFFTLVALVGLLLFLLSSENSIRWMNVALQASLFLQLGIAVSQFAEKPEFPARVSGQLFNSGHWASYLLSILPLLGAGVFRQGTSKWGKNCYGMLLIGSLFFLAESMSRAALLGAVSACLLMIPEKYWPVSSFRKKLLLIMGFVLLTGLASCFIKPGSALGRWTVYRVTLDIIMDHPWFGIGPNRFAAIYSIHQGRFLQTHAVPVHQQLLATDMQEAFNLPLQLVAEFGLLGLVIACSCFWKWRGSISWNNTNLYDESLGCFKAHFAAIAGLLVASLFSNPFHLSPVWLVILFHLSHILPAGICQKVPLEKSMIPLRSLFLLAGWCCFICIQVRSEFWWKQGMRTAIFEGYPQAKKYYQLAYSGLQKRGTFLFNYGAEAQIGEDSAKARELLLKTSRRFSSSQVYVYLGILASRAGRLKESENYFLQAIHIVPALVYPKYCLIALYLKQDKTEEASLWCKNVLAFPVKVPSLAVNELLDEIKEWKAELDRRKTNLSAFRRADVLPTQKDSVNVAGNPHKLPGIEAPP